MVQRAYIKPISQPNANAKVSLVLRLNFKVRGNSIFSNGRFIANRNDFKEASLAKTMGAIRHFLPLIGVSSKVAELKIFGDSENAPFLKYAIRELIINAVDACRENGEVTLLIRDREKHIEILCKDNGVGIRNPQQIFNFLYSNKSAVNNEKDWVTGGGGVALYFIRRTLDAIKGKIEVVETGNHGTTIKMKVPKKFSKLLSAPRMIVSQARIQGNFFAEILRGH